MITEYREFLQPEKVYIPLTDFEYKIANVHVEIGDEVVIGQVVANKFKGKQKRSIISSVSGTVVEFTEKLDRFGKVVDYIVIENNQKDTAKEVESFVDSVTPAQIRNRLEEFGIDRVSFDGLYTDIDFSNPVQHIVVNAVYANEPFISTDYEFLAENADSIADGIKLLADAAYAKSCTVIVDKFMPGAALDALGEAAVDKGIEIITKDARKVKGWDYKVLSKLAQKSVINPLENGIMYVSISAAKMVSDAVRKGIAPFSRQVAFTGDGLKVNAIYNVRVGSLFSDLVQDMEGYNQAEKMNLHVGSFLTGIQLPSDDFALVESVDTVNVAEFRESSEDVCIKCGDCNDVCPVGILPQNIMDAELRSVNARIVDLDTSKCIECGLCSFVCPSRINVLEWVRRAKRRVG